MNKNNQEKSVCKAIFSICNDTDLKLLNKILYYFQVLPRVNFSQATLAAMIGLKSKHSRRQIIRIIQDLKSMGLLEIISGRKYFNTNIYIPNPLLFQMADQLQHILSACKKYMYNKSVSFLGVNVTPYNSSLNSNPNSLHSSSSHLKFLNKSESIVDTGTKYSGLNPHGYKIFDSSPAVGIASGDFSVGDYGSCTFAEQWIMQYMPIVGNMDHTSLKNRSKEEEEELENIFGGNGYQKPYDPFDFSEYESEFGSLVDEIWR